MQQINVLLRQSENGFDGGQYGTLPGSQNFIPLRQKQQGPPLEEEPPEEDEPPPHTIVGPGPSPFNVTPPFHVVIGGEPVHRTTPSTQLGFGINEFGLH